MKSYKLLLAAFAFGSALITTGCRDEFSDTNQDPSAITTGNISFLFAEAVNRFDPQAYLEYYYNAPMKYSWSGMGISTHCRSQYPEYLFGNLRNRHVRCNTLCGSL